MVPSEPGPKAVSSFDPLEFVDSVLEASTDLETRSEPDDELDNVSVSVRSTSDWEAMTTPNSTFLSVPLMVLEADVVVWVPGGTYLGSRSSSHEQITIWCKGFIDLDRPLE